VLHRLSAAADPKVELGTVTLPNLIATACSSDGNQLYVSAHDAAANPSQFYVFDKTYARVGAPIAVPPALKAAGFSHVLAFAWTRKSGVFYGLFSSDLATPDQQLSAGQLFPFAFDGAVGAPVDAGVLHGIGEFAP
jgi:hypothetical protein